MLFRSRYANIEQGAVKQRAEELTLDPAIPFCVMNVTVDESGAPRTAVLRVAHDR